MQWESNDRLIFTKVRRDVFPEPLGPIRSMEGNMVRPLLRKTREWRKMGIVMASRIAIARPRGDGFRRACTKSCMADMIDGAGSSVGWHSCRKGCEQLSEAVE
jgi:hypothetical protein